MCDRIGIIQHGNLIGVETVSDFVGKTSDLTVRFAVKPIDKAAKVIRMLTGHDPKTDKQHLAINISHEEIPAIAEALIKDNIRLYGIQTTSKTLEEKFLEVTGGQEIV